MPPRSYTISDLGPLAQLRTGRLPRRLFQLTAGLVLYGVSLAMMVRADLGLAPWDVLHQGMTRWLPLTIGQAIIVASFVVLLLWIPLREKPGLGTVANAVLIGLAADVTLDVLPHSVDLWLRIVLLGAGLLLNGLASGLYIGAQLGRGPRDGLMTGLARRTGRSLRLVRTLIEVLVVVAGMLLGGSAGVGTLLYAFGIGPMTQATLPWVSVEPVTSS